MANWFNTLNESLAAESLVDLWPLGQNIEYGQTVQVISNGRLISIYRSNSSGRYERPVHYAC